MRAPDTAMIDGQRVLAIVPARGGSKCVPRKNLEIVGGRSLLARTLEVARESHYVDRIVVSTDDQEISEEALRCGGDVPFLRPQEIAGDETPTIDAVLHALDHFPDFGIVVVLQPTSPLRTVGDVDGCLGKLSTSQAPACVSVVRAKNHPFWTFRAENDGTLTCFVAPSLGAPTRRQDLPDAWALNGAVYVGRVPWVRVHRSFLHAGTVGYVMPQHRSLDIDTPEDLAVARRIIEVPND
jgi:CMP-N,N'-diacetyllegionaminic acid synthase